MSGVVEARGTFYAITEYKGQTYSAVKKGKIYKKESPPTMSDFASYEEKEGRFKTEGNQSLIPKLQTMITIQG